MKYKLLIWIFILIALSSLISALLAETSRWDFENDLTDSTGSYNLGVLEGSTSFNFNSRVGDYSFFFPGGTIIGVNSGYPQLNTAYTHAFWMYVNGTDGTNNPYVFRQGSGNFEQRIAFSIYNDNRLYIGYSTGSSQPGLTCFLGQGVTDKWVHLVLSINSSSADIYVDGQQNCTTSGVTPNSNEGIFHLGGRPGNELYLKNVSLDDYRVWVGTALSAAQVLELYDSYDDTIPPAISNGICSGMSCIEGTNNAVDSTPTINFTVTDYTGVQMVWMGNDSGLTAANAGSTRECIKGSCADDSKDCTWICTLPSSDELTTLVPQPVYVVANDTLGYAHTAYGYTMNITLLGILKGTVKDSNSINVEDALITVKLNDTATILYNTTTNSTGEWEINTISLAGYYTICAYKPSNSSLRGDCVPFVQVP